MSSTLVNIAYVHASRKTIPDIHSATMKSGILKSFPNVRVVYVKTTRNYEGVEVYVFHLRVTRGTEGNYQALMDRIGSNFYQGDQFVIYKWRSTDEANSKTQTTLNHEPTRAEASKIGYMAPSTTLGATLDPSIQVMRLERRIVPPAPSSIPVSSWASLMKA
jgi:hypothetical protein